MVDVRKMLTYLVAGRNMEPCMKTAPESRTNQQEATSPWLQTQQVTQQLPPQYGNSKLKKKNENKSNTNISYKKIEVNKKEPKKIPAYGRPINLLMCADSCTNKISFS